MAALTLRRRGGRSWRRGRAATAAKVGLLSLGALLLGALGPGFLRPPALAPTGPAPTAAASPGRPEVPAPRRAAFAGTAAALATAAGGALGPIRAAEAAEPQVTSRCAFEVKIGTGNSVKSRRLVIGLFEKEAPVLTRNFIQACTATYPGQAGLQVSYKLADVKNIVKDKAILWADFKEGNLFYKEIPTDDKRWVGNKFEKLPLAEQDTLTDETNSLRHDVAGRVSMRKGGGTFDFTVAPVADATWLDQTDVVIGQVLEGMDLIADINKVTMYNDKPLKKVRIFSSKLVPAGASA